MRTPTAAFLLSLSLGLACGGSPPAPAEPTPVEAEPGATDPADAPADPAVAEADAEATAKAAAEADAAQKKAAELAALERARPILETHCARCHKTGGKKAKPKVLAHFSLDTYPFPGHEGESVTGEIREVLGIGGGKATMPYDKPGAVKGDELAAVAAWADAYDAANPAPAK